MNVASGLVPDVASPGKASQLPLACARLRENAPSAFSIGPWVRSKMNVASGLVPDVHGCIPDMRIEPTQELTCGESQPSLPRKAAYLAEAPYDNSCEIM